MTTTTTTLHTLVETMVAAKLQYDAAVLLRVTMAGKDHSEGALNPPVYRTAVNIAFSAEAAAFHPWRDARVALRRWGAENRANDGTVERELGEYADALSDTDLSEVVLLITEWRSPAR